MKLSGIKSIGLMLALLLSIVPLSTCGDSGATVKKTKKTKKTKKPKKKRANKFTIIERVSDTAMEGKLYYKVDKLDISNVTVTIGGTKTTVAIESIEVMKTKKNKGKMIRIVMAKPMLKSKNYSVGVTSFDEKAGKVKTINGQAMWGDKAMNTWGSDKAMGLTIKGRTYTFRVFSPRATSVKLCMFKKPYTDKPAQNPQEGEKQYDMVKDKDGVWEYTLKGNYMGKFYGYRVAGPTGKRENFHPEIVVADPYSRAVATRQVAPQCQLTVIVDTKSYKWKSKKKYMGYKQEEMIVYEMHVRDMTMLSPDIKNKGTYAGLCEDNKTGGLAYIKELGVNCIELLPVQEFNEIEVAYRKKEKGTIYNTWNAYGRNHWGYMTSCFFAPEALYYEGKYTDDKWIGVDGGQVNALKKLVDTYHQNGIAVVMDVVYNHVSQYDRNALKYIDHIYYFWEKANSGCGNDYKTDYPMAKRLVVDSCEYFVKDYRIDGYRFDLGTIIDWKTYGLIKKAVYAINPETFLVAEPWMGGRGGDRDGGGYSPKGMAQHGIGAWNDKVREPIKGLATGGANYHSLKDGVKAFPSTFLKPKYSLSYVESHDGYTLSDHIRKSSKWIDERKDPVFPKDYIKAATLNEKQMKQNKIALMYLMTVQGPVMMHEGMEIARMKINKAPTFRDNFPQNYAKWEMTEKPGKKARKKGFYKGQMVPKLVWKDMKNSVMSKRKKKLVPLTWPKGNNAVPYYMDHNSYEKDNECNWINWELKKVNAELFDYVSAMIRLRKKYKKTFGLYDIKKLKKKDIFKGKKSNKAIGYHYKKEVSGDDRSFVVLVNGDKKAVTFKLPEGEWTVMVDGKKVSFEGDKATETVSVPKMEGMILYKK